MGSYPAATAVFDVDAIGLTNIVNNLNQGLDIGGNPIGSQTSLLLGVGANPGAMNLDEEIRRLRVEGAGRRRVRGDATGIRHGPVGAVLPPHRAFAGFR